MVAQQQLREGEWRTAQHHILIFKNWRPPGLGLKQPSPFEAQPQPATVHVDLGPTGIACQRRTGQALLKDRRDMAEKGRDIGNTNVPSIGRLDTRRQSVAEQIVERMLAVEMEGDL